MKDKNRTQIDFIGIGTQKSGTGWLFQNLKKIPEFTMLPIKELHYFDRSREYPSPNKLSKTRLSKRIVDPKYLFEALKSLRVVTEKNGLKKLHFFSKWYFSDYDDNWYLSLYNGFDGYKGEITPSYSMLKEEDIQRMYNLAPNAKLILMLRNPIDRAWSQYRFNARFVPNFKPEDDKDHEAILKFLDSEGQVLRSNYTRTLENYLKVFPAEQILICFYDSLSKNPDLLLKDIIKFICGNTAVNLSHIDLGRVVNKSRALARPPEIEKYLKNKYYDQIKQLAEAYGGYFNVWLEKTYGEKSSNPNHVLSPTMHPRKNS